MSVAEITHLANLAVQDARRLLGRPLIPTESTAIAADDDAPAIGDTPVALAPPLPAVHPPHVAAIQPWRDVYEEIKRELIARGVNPDEVQFIQHHNSKTKRAALFAAMNNGSVRVLLCSKQSTGMNVQKRLVALHHVDCPWRPGDLEQREGRIVRQGNLLPEVMIAAYVTAGSFDGYKWQAIETKSAFIEQIRRGDVTMRTAEDIGEAVMSAAEIKALASGNPLVMEKVKADIELQKLEAAAAADREGKVRLRSRIRDNQYERERLGKKLPEAETMAAQAQATATDEFTAAIANGALSSEATAYTKRDAAGQAVIKVLGELLEVANQRRETQRRVIGLYRGFEVHAFASAAAYGGGAVEVTVRFTIDGESRTASKMPIALNTPRGVFQSVDSQLRDLNEEPDRIRQKLAELDADDTKLKALLAIPWERATELQELHARVEQLNILLSQSENKADAEAQAEDEDEDNAEDDADVPAMPTALRVTANSDDAPLDGATSLSDIIAAQRARKQAEEAAALAAEDAAALAMDHPLVLLPEPADPDAMERAIRLLAGAEDEAVVAEEIEEDAATDEDADTLELPPTVLVIPQPQAVPVIPATSPTIIFGAALPLPAKRAKARKLQATTATVAYRDLTGQLDLFSMFDTPNDAAAAPVLPQPTNGEAVQVTLW